MSVTIVIGKNFGDEGKGLAIDYFESRYTQAGCSAVCVRHNGGAQAGHTVDMPNKRFVFSQLSSASFRGADTYWADSFLPDLFKLTDEAERFRSINGNIPRIFASSKCRCTYIDDVLVNMLLETQRGKNRHGSCGMGINEAVVRSAGFPLYLGDAAGLSAEMLCQKLRIFRREFLPERLAALHIDLNSAGEYGEMLQNDRVLSNAAEGICRGAEYIQMKKTDCLKEYGTILFEGAQGLLLDERYTRFAPHLTSSRTGLYEPARILHEVYGERPTEKPIEIVYVTRSYVTRHGAGPLPNEDTSDSINHFDRTNIPNEWQGSLRFALHGSTAEFTEAVQSDLAEAMLPAKVSLFVTHLNESAGAIITKDGQIPAESYFRQRDIQELFSTVYLSDSPFAEDVRALC